MVETIANVIFCACFGLVAATVFTAFENLLLRELTVSAPNFEPDSAPVQPTPGEWEQPPSSNQACPVCLERPDPIKHSGKVNHYHISEYRKENT